MKYIALASDETNYNNVYESFSKKYNYSTSIKDYANSLVSDNGNYYENPFKNFRHSSTPFSILAIEESIPSFESNEYPLKNVYTDEDILNAGKDLSNIVNIKLLPLNNNTIDFLLDEGFNYDLLLYYSVQSEDLEVAKHLLIDKQDFSQDNFASVYILMNSKYENESLSEQTSKSYSSKIDSLINLCPIDNATRNELLQVFLTTNLKLAEEIITPDMFISEKVLDTAVKPLISNEDHYTKFDNGENFPLKLLKENGVDILDPSKHLFEKAAASGNIMALQYMRKLGCPVSNEAITLASRYNNIDSLKYLKSEKNSNSNNLEDLINSAKSDISQKNIMNLLDFAKEREEIIHNFHLYNPKEDDEKQAIAIEKNFLSLLDLYKKAPDMVVIDSDRINNLLIDVTSNFWGEDDNSLEDSLHYAFENTFFSLLDNISTTDLLRMKAHLSDGGIIDGGPFFYRQYWNERLVDIIDDELSEERNININLD